VVRIQAAGGNQEGVHLVPALRSQAEERRSWQARHSVAERVSRTAQEAMMVAHQEDLVDHNHHHARWEAFPNRSNAYLPQ
jgi:hypothetical protein